MEQDPKALFGQKLRSLRKAKGMSQEGLAFEAGLDRTYIGGIENGKRNVSLVNIYKLAKALDIPAASLFESDCDNEAGSRMDKQD